MRDRDVGLHTSDAAAPDVSAREPKTGLNQREECSDGRAGS